MPPKRRIILQKPLSDDNNNAQRSTKGVSNRNISVAGTDHNPKGQAEMGMVDPTLQVGDGVFEDDQIKIAVEISEDDFLDETEFVVNPVNDPTMVQAVNEVNATTPKARVHAGESSQEQPSTSGMPQMLMQSPELQAMLMNMVQEGVKMALQQGNVMGTPMASEGNVKAKVSNVKSPSDTTIYVPALKLTPNKHTLMGN